MIDLDNLRKLVAGWDGVFLTDDDGALAFEPASNPDRLPPPVIDEVEDGPEMVATMLNALGPLLADHTRLGAEVEAERDAHHQTCDALARERAEVARLTRELTDSEEAAGSWREQAQLVAAEVARLRGLLADHDIVGRVLADGTDKDRADRHTLRLRLAAVERERDEARAEHTRDAIVSHERIDAEQDANRELRRLVEAARKEAATDRLDVAVAYRERAEGEGLMRAVERDRDAAIQRLAAPIACPRCGRDDMTLGDLPGHLPCLSRTEAEEDAEARRAQVEAETEAGIVAYLRRRAAEKHRDVNPYAPDDGDRSADALLSEVDDIAAGAWRGKEGV